MTYLEEVYYFVISYNNSVSIICLSIYDWANYTLSVPILEFFDLVTLVHAINNRWDQILYFLNYCLSKWMFRLLFSQVSKVKKLILIRHGFSKLEMFMNRKKIFYLGTPRCQCTCLVKHYSSDFVYLFKDISSLN